MNRNNSYDILNLPPRLFKYYSYDSKLNAKRLSGEIYLACPYDFNDPCDCRREIINNSKDRVIDKGKQWLKQKMQELDYNERDSQDIADRLLNNDTQTIKQVHKRMLERLGLLCLTTTRADTLMWGYYANNNGICLEYDVTKIVRNLVIGYINKMSYTTTRYLYTNEKYYQSSDIRTPSLTSEILQKAESMITKTDIKRITNKFLEEQTNEDAILNFARNIFLKRIYAKPIVYNISPDGSPSPLFFDRNNKTSETKYFKKTKTWSHEKEFRFIVSLGGRLAINIGKDCIKNVYLGCNMPNERIVAIAHLMAKNNLSANLYKMKRLKNCGLSPKQIKWKIYKNNLDEFEHNLTEQFPGD